MKRLGPLSRPLFAVMLVFTIFACSGGGCSGCAGCGIYPIPGGFPIAERIHNSAQVRLTESGIDFIEDNIDGIVGILLPDGLDFPVPETSGSTTILFITMRYTVCPSSRPPCYVHAEIANLELTPTAPNRLHAVAQLRLWSTDAAGTPTPLFVDTNLGDLNVNLDTRMGSRDFVAIQADIDFANIGPDRPARQGYTQIVVGGIELVEGQGIEDDDIDISSGGGIGGGFLSFIANLFKGMIVDLLVDQIAGLSDGLLGDNLCTRRGTTGCPTGTHDRGNTAEDAVCYYEPAGGSDECVPMLLGMDGRGDLGGQFLGGFSPGAHAPIQLVLASGGDGEAVNNGMSLFFEGGFMSMDRAFATSPGHNPCVPLREEPPLPDIARVAAFRGNVIPGTSTPSHIGVGIAEDYLNYAGYGMYDSGMLCIGAGTRLSQQLSSGLFSLPVRSVSQLAFPQESAPLTMAIRPQNPPVFTIGTDAASPLISVSMDDLMIDFYIWSTERYVRFMTYQTDLVVNINLSVEGGEIVPMIESVVPTNSMVFNNEMITEDPAAVAESLEVIISSFAGMLAGSISPFALPEIMGFELDVPEGGVRGVADGGERFLGIFANLRLAGAMPLTAPVETRLEVGDLQLDRDSMSLERFNSGEGNSAWLHFGAESATSGATYEYSYRIDGMTWSRWSTDPRVRIDHDVLLLQARHEIEARARIVGQAATVDTTPARAELIVDIEAPVVQLSRDERGYVASAHDLITADGMQYRFRVREGEWSDWQSDPRYVPETLDLSGGLITVEARDEAGNVGTAQMPLIRGLPNPAGGGCECGVLDGSPERNGPLALLGSLVVLGLTLARRRRTVLKAIVLGAIAVGTLSIVAGCDCSGPMMTVNCNDDCIAARPPAMTSGEICCEATQECELYDVEDLCPTPGFFCPVDNVEIDDTCDITCSECMPKPPLDPGVLATDLDLVITPEGDQFVSGYSPGVPADGDYYGDLVFGQVQTGGTVDWEIVDGAPSSPVDGDPSGWRGGVRSPGEDVGRFTAMAHSGTDFYIAYYDATNGALKMAIGGPGAWNVHTIDDAGDSGRYPSIVLVAGVPTISYLRVETDAMDATRVRSSVRVATAASTAPMSATDWTITEVAGLVTPCRPMFCEGGTTCLEDGRCVTPSTDCPMACGADQACVAGACVAALPDPYVEDLPPAYGLHTSLAVTSGGLGLVWYDRSSGNIYGASQTGGTWGAPFLIDGYLRADPNVGDSGIGASLFVDAAGTWHVTYVDGAEETLRYARFTSPTAITYEIVDDGATPDGMTRHTDGRHIVGDDSSVVVTDAGEVRVAYQDATDRTVMLARRASGATTWTISVVDDVDNTGFWVEQVLVGTTSYVGTWWRRQSRTDPADGVRVVTAD